MKDLFCVLLLISFLLLAFANGQVCPLGLRCRSMSAKTGRRYLRLIPQSLQKLCRMPSGLRGICCPNDCGLFPRAESVKVSPFDIVTHISNGIDSEVGAWPWMISLFQTLNNDPDNQHHVCGAVLIHPKYALTAAHCFDNSGRNNVTHTISDVSPFIIRISGFNISKSAEQDNAFESELSEVKLHHNYTGPGSLNYDIALMKLKNPPSQPTVKPICLPRPFFLNMTEETRYGMILGWGLTNASSYRGAKILQQAVVPLHAVTNCSNEYTQTLRAQGAEDFLRTLFPQGIDNKFVCAGDVGSSTMACSGDSGGPLMWRSMEKRWVLLGVLSSGSSVCGHLVRNLYTNVEQYFDWIEANVV